MIIYPAIDIMDGKCVRLVEGVKENSTVYYENPVDAAKMWQDKGAKYIHLVDLDGAFEGKLKNGKIIEEIVAAVNIPVQLGGGLRTIENVKHVIDIGISRAIIGTAAVMDEKFLDKAAGFGEKIAVGIDAKNGFVAIKGWVEVLDITAFDFAIKVMEKGIMDIIYTDISRDGKLVGPNFRGVEKMCSIAGGRIIASGGVTNVSDLIKLKEIGAHGAIIGKALYNGNIKLEIALGI